MSVSRLQAALASATNEVTLAAANINFDFTLVKCEAPKEYQKLGNVLSKSRKAQAELGSPHITARRLGALFDRICPPTPNLIKAYGTRVSEIAEAAKTSNEPGNGIFAEHMGVDGTSIWAAATSSSTALQLQLLACMLARVWPAQEATSIWVELVNERRKEIERQFENCEEVHFATLAAAAQAEISRKVLAEWDASVRAWLNTADRVKAREQTQLRLIIANLDSAVNKDVAVLPSVMEAWKAALESMENLTCGMPQALVEGPTLLALSSWHLYGDLLVMGKDPADVHFGDHLIPKGGSFTVGLARDTENGSQARRGVYWSLSLKHLRFYGSSVLSEACLDKDFSNVSFSQFCLAVLGCLLGSWSVRCSQISAAARFFASIDAAIGRASHLSSIFTDPTIPDSLSWLRMMGSAASALLDKASDERETALRLLKLGLRRSSKFIPGGVEPFFDLLSPKRLIRCLKGPKERIAYLRRIALTSTGFRGTPFIGYFESSKSKIPKITHVSSVFCSSEEHNVEAAANRGETWDLNDHVDQNLDENGDTPRPKVHFHVKIIHDDIQGFEDMDTSMQYIPIFGDPKVACLYQDAKLGSVRVRDQTIEDISRCLDQDMFSLVDLMVHIQDELRLGPTPKIRKAMAQLSIASKVYQYLPGAMVAIKALDRRVTSAAWGREILPLPKDSGKITISRTLALSCVAYMSCGVDVDPSVLKGAFAMAHEDSLYIAKQLICDPWERTEPYELCRVLGNVGRPGVTMLVPPQNPIIRAPSHSSWKVIQHCAFNGADEDHLKNTSLHLSFTEYYVPLYANQLHRQDHEVSFWESVVSVHDSGKWIGDIDIVKALEKRSVLRLSLNPDCCHRGDLHKSDFNIISAEGWNEILDLPGELFVVRAYGNWIGRLAALAVLSETLPEDAGCIIICPKKVCWSCIEAERPTDSIRVSRSNWRKPAVFIY